jgi:GNAT superfamily N-acetyltransferase
MASEVARPAAADDRDGCLRLAAEALEAVGALRGGAALRGDGSAESLLTRWTAEGGGVQLFVGEYEDALVGLAAVSTVTAGERRSGLIECCYVEPEARGVGVGTALMDAAVAWCGAQGCNEVDALALPGDRATKQRLEAAGFTARLLTLNRRLD